MSETDDQSEHFGVFGLSAVGSFFLAFSATEILIDCAIGSLLGISDANTHVMTAGLEIGRKFSMLKGLITNSDHPDKLKMVRLIDAIQNESKRNALAHGYVTAGPDLISFIHRGIQGGYVCKEHFFSHSELMLHAIKLGERGSELQGLLGVTNERLNEFGRAAMRATSKP